MTNLYGMKDFMLNDDERNEITTSLIKFVKRVAAGKGNPAEIGVLPEIVKLLLICTDPIAEDMEAERGLETLQKHRFLRSLRNVPQELLDNKDADPTPGEE